MTPVLACAAFVMASPLPAAAQSTPVVDANTVTQIVGACKGDAGGCIAAIKTAYEDAKFAAALRGISETQFENGLVDSFVASVAGALAAEADSTRFSYIDTQMFEGLSALADYATNENQSRAVKILSLDVLSGRVNEENLRAATAASPA